MTLSDSLFTGSIPQLYDSLMVPMLFLPYADDMARRVVALGPRDILEIAAGTGVVTRKMAATLPPGARITATDLNQPMLDLAALALASDARFTFSKADAMALPFPDARFDAVVCQFGVMFFPDQPRAFAEAFRVLRTGGHYLFNVWGSIAENAFVASASRSLAAAFPDNPSVFMERTPHGHFDTARLALMLQAAGFAVTQIETLDDQSVAATPLDAAMAYCQGTPLRAEILARDPDGLSQITDLVATGLARDFGPGPIKGAIRAHVIHAAKP